MLEQKIDGGFREMRAQVVSTERALRAEIIAARGEARADFRTLIAVTFAMWVATVLTVVGVLTARL